MRIPYTNILIALVAVLLTVGCANKPRRPGSATGPSSNNKVVEEPVENKNQDDADEREEDLVDDEEDELQRVLNQILNEERREGIRDDDFVDGDVVNPSEGLDLADGNPRQIADAPVPNAGLVPPRSLAEASGRQGPVRRTTERVRQAFSHTGDRRQDTRTH